jgi:hypothetical protein
MVRDSRQTLAGVNQVLQDEMISLRLFRERSRTALRFSRAAIACLIGEVLFRHSFGISPPIAPVPSD